MGKNKFGSDGYAEWLDLVPVEERETLAAVLTENPVKNYDDLVSFSQTVMVHILCGNIAPCVADAASRWAELMLTALAAKHTASGTPGEAYSDLISALVAVKDEAPAIEAVYTAEVVDESVKATG